MDFNYVVQRQEKAKVCFGSGLERQLLDFDRKGLVSKHARNNMRNFFDVGPYDISVQTSALSGILRKPTSIRGTVLGGRTARRDTYSDTVLSPGPIYNLPSFPKEVKESCAPFSGWEERGKIQIPDVPGVGLYKVATYKRRRPPYGHSFGGAKCLLPAVKMKCGPFNFDTCERCRKFPEGDYWYLDTVAAGTLVQKKKKKNKDHEPSGTFLCRACYDLENQDHKTFNKGQMRNFKKIRDCSKVHFHDGCEAKLFLISPQEIEKIKERESYFSLYFN